MTHKISLVLGDWSDDGHGKTDIVTIESNFTPAKIKKAYKKGTELVGVDLTEDVCSEYEEHQMTPEHYEVFKASGVLGDLSDESWDRYLDSDTFAELYLWVAKQGNPEFEYKIVPNSSASINIGGYGLFE